MDIPIKKKTFTKSKITVLIGAFLLVALIIFTIASTGGTSKLKVNINRISISEVKEGIFQENISVSGFVLPITTIYLDALEGGRVDEIFVEDGAIKQGVQGLNTGVKVITSSNDNYGDKQELILN